MKYIIYILIASITFSCVYDPPNPGPVIIYNCSDKPIYWYFSKDGELTSEPRLVLFETIQNDRIKSSFGCTNVLKAPNYRIDAYTETKYSDNLFTNINDPLPDSLIFYFFMEETMRKSSWEDIVKKKKYDRRLSVSKEVFLENFQTVIYTPQ